MQVLQCRLSIVGGFDVLTCYNCLSLAKTRVLSVSFCEVVTRQLPQSWGSFSFLQSEELIGSLYLEYLFAFLYFCMT